MCSSRYPFLPTTREEMQARGFEELDVVIVSGDAYVDHPAFGAPLIGRFLEAQGFRVGILAQPDWRSKGAFQALGRPKLFFGVTAGNLDSMLNRLTAQKRNRSEDPYSPGGRTGLRPDRATIVYANRCREAFSGVPIVLGGIEAALRRLAHFDYWSETVRKSILIDAKADLLVFGMGERPILEIARRLERGETSASIRNVRGTSFVLSREDAAHLESEPSRRVGDGRPVILPSFEDVERDKHAFAIAARMSHYETNPYNARPLFQRHGERAVYSNPPALPLADGAEEELSMDRIYGLPFNRRPHPSYAERIPALETVKHSITLMRGCFGGCTFCSITEHEGRIVQNRSTDSVIQEVTALKAQADFPGVISDLGGPTANMYKMRCRSRPIESQCRRPSCVYPRICKNLETDHAPLISLMRKVREEEGIKRVFIASGVRFDLAERSWEYISELAANHVGGHLSVAPEHISSRVLAKMRKPEKGVYERFRGLFSRASRDAGKEQYDIPYFISGHPGSTLADMIELALWLKRNNLRPRQVQEFIPTPMSIATTMYYTGLDPLAMEPVSCARGAKEKKLQKALLLYWDRAQWPLLREALQLAGRADLIGHRPGDLVPPDSAARRIRTQRN